MRRFKFPKLSHPWAKSKAGFTLVELIVVIAIMGILAGVGTVGYSGYVKASQKGNDKVLVGNIIRAIETGTYSTMFVNDDSFKMGEMAYPVGFVALSTNSGAQVVTSETKMKPNEVKEAGACVFETIENVLVQTPHTYESGCTKNTTGTYYTISSGTVTYCTTHSSVPANVVSSDGQSYTSNYTHKKGNNITGCLFSCGGITPVLTDYPAGMKIISNQSSLELKKTDTLCDIAYAYQYDTYDGNTTNVAARDSGPLYEALTAAFGDLSTLTLTHDGWVSDEGVNYATFYNSAPELMGDLKTLSGLLVIGQGLAQLAGKDLGLKGDYDNGEDVLAGVSSEIVTTFITEEEWMVKWNNAADATWDSYGFGLAGRENYSAARMGYNTAFASYVESRDSSFAPGGTNASYIDKIENFYSQEMFGVGLPGLICTDAFTDPDCELKSKINNDAVFEKLAGYFEDYKSSDACEENGRVFYKTIKTFNDTSDIASDPNNAYGGDIYAYYNSYVNEISALYSKAQEAASGGIVIIVTVDGGEMKCVVSPEAADPRDK